MTSALRCPRASHSAQRIALVIVTATVALLDLACLDERRARSLLEEAISMRTAYLAPYLD